jgi:hypothetical protein
MTRWVALGAVLVVAGCSGSPPPPPPPVAVQICPPDPAPGSGLVCAPPKACQLDPKFLALINGPLGDLVPEKWQKYRDAAGHLALAIQDLCQDPAS